MTAAIFYAATSLASVLAVFAEYRFDKKRGGKWHAPVDTMANFNLAAGNLLLGVYVAAWVGVGYGGLYGLRVIDVTSDWSTPVLMGVSVLVCDFLQYWNHRLSHNWNALWWGHITHHSSPHMNLSTGVRVNWVYRALAWVLYAPMPLLGFPLEAFIVGQTVINVYNLFMHTRWRTHFGLLKWFLVTPLAHRLHHSSDPKYFGNYGAALIIWDRIFGTHREISVDESERSLTYGVNRSVTSPNPWAMNFHYISEMRERALDDGRPFLLEFFSRPSPMNPQQHQRGAARGPVPVVLWVGLVGVVALAIAVNQSANAVPVWAHILAVATGMGGVTLFGAALSRSKASADAA